MGLFLLTISCPKATPDVCRTKTNFSEAFVRELRRPFHSNVYNVSGSSFRNVDSSALLVLPVQVAHDEQRQTNHLQWPLQVQ